MPSYGVLVVIPDLVDLSLTAKSNPDRDLVSYQNMSLGSPCFRRALPDWNPQPVAAGRR